VVDRQRGYKLPIAYTHEKLATMIGARDGVQDPRAAPERGVVELRRRRIHVRGPKRLRCIAEQER
jgi:hypothetical protein